jgi:hypothetical protein
LNFEAIEKNFWKKTLSKVSLKQHNLFGMVALLLSAG